MALPVTTFSEKRQLNLALALSLFDQFTRKRALLGKVKVSVAGKPPVKPFVAYQKEAGATFLFFDLPDGAYTFEIRSEGQTPYYVARDINITLPMPDPLWPAFPNVKLADEDLPLDDPAQPPPYRAQHLEATLEPATTYPFPEGSTLVRGTVRSGPDPLAEATVQPLGEDFQYLTGESGEYVLFFPGINGPQQTVTLRATHASHPLVDGNVEVRRGMTVAQDFDLP
jgi:hypothetical protein